MKTAILLCILFICGILSAQGGGTALDFDGGDDHIDYGHNSTLNPGTESFSISLWIKPDDLTDVKRFVWKNNGTTPPFDGYYFNTNSTNLGGGFGDNVFSTEVTNGVLTENWQHVTIVRDVVSEKVMLFLNGIKIDEETDTTMDIDYTGFLELGGRIYLENYIEMFDGLLDEFQIFAAALDSSTILDWTFKKLSVDHPNWSELVCFCDFDEGSGSIAYDSSTHNNDGTLTNMNPAEDWVTSYAPLATDLTEDLYEVKAVWAAIDSNYSSIMSLQDENITGEDCLIFGHNNGDLSFDSSNVSAGIENRLSRVWRLEEYGNLTGDVIFDCSGFGTRNENYRLLEDDDGDFSDAAIITGSYDTSEFTVSAHEFEHSYYYTLALAEELTEPPARFAHSMVNINDTLYVFGGYSTEDRGEIFNDLWEFVSAPSWKDIQPTGNIPVGRYYHGAAAENGKMYIFFGADGQGGVHSDSWVYDPNNNTWTEITAGGGPNPRQQHTATSLGDGRIVVFGGREQWAYADAYAWIYNTTTGNWTQGSGLPAGSRYFHGAVNNNGKVYIFGGQTDAGYSNEMWKYNPDTDTWTEIDQGATLPSQRQIPVIVSELQNLIWLYGGEEGHGRTFINDLWEFDVTASTWQQLPDPPYTRKLTDAEMSGDDDIVIFGGRNENNDQTSTTLNYNISSGSWCDLGDSLTAPSAPVNTTIYAENDSVFVSWTAVCGATSYKVYSSDDPYEPLENWDFEEEVTDTNWSEPVLTNEKKFYYVRAVN